VTAIESIRDFKNLGARATRMLRQLMKPKPIGAGITTLKELVDCSMVYLLSVPGMGPSTAKEIKAFAKRNYHGVGEPSEQVSHQDRAHVAGLMMQALLMRSGRGPAAGRTLSTEQKRRMASEAVELADSLFAALTSDEPSPATATQPHRATESHNGQDVPAGTGQDVPPTQRM
jgi:hypothetical protein